MKQSIENIIPQADYISKRKSGRPLKTDTTPVKPKSPTATITFTKGRTETVYEWLLDEYPEKIDEMTDEQLEMAKRTTIGDLV